MGLAGEYKSIPEFFVCQRIILIHGYFSFKQFGAAGCAYPSLAGIGEISALFDGRIQDCISFIRELKIVA